MSLGNTEGAGKTGCSMHPQPRVQSKKAHERNHHRYAELVRPSLRNGFNAYSALSPVNGLFCHRRLRFLSQT